MTYPTLINGRVINGAGGEFVPPAELPIIDIPSLATGAVFGPARVEEVQKPVDVVLLMEPMATGAKFGQASINLETVELNMEPMATGATFGAAKALLVVTPEVEPSTAFGVPFVSLVASPATVGKSGDFPQPKAYAIFNMPGWLSGGFGSAVVSAEGGLIDMESLATGAVFGQPELVPVCHMRPIVSTAYMGEPSIFRRAEC